MREAGGFGALLGALLGSTTLIFGGEPIGILLGVAFGLVYGIAFGLTGWLIGWLLFNSGLLLRKGASLGWGVVAAAFVYCLGLWLVGGTLDVFLVLIPAAVAAATGLLRGRWYDERTASGLVDRARP